MAVVSVWTSSAVVHTW